MSLTTLRNSRKQAAITVATAVGSSTEIDYRESGSGSFSFVSGSLATITWHVSYDGTTYVAAYNQAGTTAITQAVAANRGYPIPTELAGAAYIKPVGDAAGVINVTLKS